MSFQHNNLKKTKLSKSTCHFKIIIKENQIKTFPGLHRFPIFNSTLLKLKYIYDEPTRINRQPYWFLIIKETLDNTLTYKDCEKIVNFL